MAEFRVPFRQIAVLLFIAFFLSGVANTRLSHAGKQACPADYYMVTTTAPYRPVNVPGTQRRVAQTDAEEKAKRLIYEHVGSLPATAAGRTINDVISRDARLKGKILEMIRNAELVDWNVTPKWSCVTVCMRINLCQVREILAICGYR